MKGENNLSMYFSMSMRGGYVHLKYWMTTSDSHLILRGSTAAAFLGSLVTNEVMYLNTDFWSILHTHARSPFLLFQKIGKEKKREKGTALYKTGYPSRNVIYFFSF